MVDTDIQLADHTDKHQSRSTPILYTHHSHHSHHTHHYRSRAESESTDSKDYSSTWTEEIEMTLQSWLAEAEGWIFIHSKNKNYFAKLYTAVNVSAVICALISTVGICFNDLYKDRWPLYMFAAFGGLSAALPYYINTQFNLKKNSSSHKHAAHDWIILARNIRSELRKQPKNRVDANTFANLMEKEFANIHNKAPVSKQRYVQEWSDERRRRPSAWTSLNMSDIDLEAGIIHDVLPPISNKYKGSDHKGKKIINENLSVGTNIIISSPLTNINRVDSSRMGNTLGEEQVAERPDIIDPNRPQAPTDDKPASSSRLPKVSRSRSTSVQSRHEGFVSEPSLDNYRHDYNCVRTLISDRVDRANKFNIELNYNKMRGGGNRQHLYAISYGV
jgi:hypothetical protein